jgi:hypothetical protein
MDEKTTLASVGMSAPSESTKLTVTVALPCGVMLADDNPMAFSIKPAPVPEPILISLTLVVELPGVKNGLSPAEHALSTVNNIKNKNFKTENPGPVFIKMYSEKQCSNNT